MQRRATCEARIADNKPTGFDRPARVDVVAKRGQTLPLEMREQHMTAVITIFFSIKHTNFVPIIRLTE